MLTGLLTNPPTWLELNPHSALSSGLQQAVAWLGKGPLMGNNDISHDAMCPFNS